MKLSDVVVYLVLVLAGVANTENKGDSLSSDSLQAYRPFTAYCVWDRSKNEYIQRHYISQIMDNTTIGTRIILNTVDAIKMDFKHSKKQTMSTEIVKLNNELSANNIISYLSLKGDISKRLQSTEKRAFELHFFVNENTKVDLEGTALEELKRFKVFVVYCGPDHVPGFWTSLATDKLHLLHIKSMKSHKTLSDYIGVMHHDSGLPCDTDMFWTGTNCISCNFTCTDKRSDHCQIHCPYFDKNPLESDRCTEICVYNTILTIAFVAIIIIFCIVLFNEKLYFLLRKCIYFLLRKCKRGRGSDNNLTNRTVEPLKSASASEEDDDAETSADQSLVRAPLVNGNRNGRHSPQRKCQLPICVPPANGNERQSQESLRHRKRQWNGREYSFGHSYP